MKSLKPALIACLALLMVAPPALAGSGNTSSTPSAHTELARFGGGGFGSRGFGSRGFGSRGFGSRNGGFGGRGFRRRHGIFRSIIRALAIGYLIHLLFTTPGGLIVLLLMIVGVMLLMSRFRRRSSFRY